MRKILLAAASLSFIALIACQPKTIAEPQPSIAEKQSVVDKPTTTVENLTAAATAGTENGPPTIQEAKEFLEQSEKDIVELSSFAAKVYWVQANFITEDTNALAAMAGTQGAKLSTRLANEAKRFNDLSLPVDMRRKMDGLKRGSNFPAPEKEGAAEELATIMTGLEATYGTGKFEHNEKTLNLGQASDIIAKSRDPEELKAIWEGWRTISPPMKEKYSRMVLSLIHISEPTRPY